MWSLEMKSMKKESCDYVEVFQICSERKQQERGVLVLSDQLMLLLFSI